MTTYNLAGAILEAGPVRASDFLQEVTDWKPASVGDAWCLPIARVDRAEVPTNMRHAPFVPGHWFEAGWMDRPDRFVESGRCVRFDLGRFIDFAEAANWVDAIRPSSPQLSKEDRRSILAAPREWGPLGRRLYRVSDPEFSDFRKDLDHHQKFYIRAWNDGRLGYKHGFLLEPAIDWVVELHALRATLRVIDHYKTFQGKFESEFTRVPEEDERGRPIGSWVAEGYHFHPTGLFANEVQAGHFLQLLRLPEFSSLAAPHKKSVRQRAEFSNRPFDPDAAWKLCVWKLIEMQISRFLESQLSIDIRLRRAGSGETQAGAIRPRSLAGVIWLSLANYLNGSTLVEKCDYCGKRYSLSGRELSRRSSDSEKFRAPRENYCPASRFGKRCYREWKKEKANGAQGR